jgi:hypothetical protein
MKTLLSVFLIAVLVTLFVPAPALASPVEVLGSCPVGFELHHFMEHDGEHMHRHIGITQDLNGDGFICMKMLTNDLHLHVDNSFILP